MNNDNNCNMLQYYNLELLPHIQVMHTSVLRSPCMVQMHNFMSLPRGLSYIN